MLATAVTIGLSDPAAHAAGATIVVDTGADTVTVDGQCSLREAILAVNTNSPTGDCAGGTDEEDTIVFGANSFIELTSDLRPQNPKTPMQQC